MTVSREFVCGAFMEHLGRSPESEQTISHYMNCENRAEVVRILTRSAEYFKNKFSNEKFDDQAQKKFLLIGNCQVAVVKKLLESMCSEVSVVSIGIEGNNLHGLMSGNLKIGNYVEACDIVMLQVMPGDRLHTKLTESYPALINKIKYIPSITYTAHHPDMGYIKSANGSHLGGPMGDYHSKIAFWAWQNGLTQEEAVKLYCSDVYEFLGYFDHAKSAEHYLKDLGERMSLDLQHAFDRWRSMGEFMHSLNHPKLFVLADLARLILEREGLSYTRGVENYLYDEFSAHPCWPVYPEIGRNFGIAGSYSFKQAKHLGSPHRPVPMLNLKKYVQLAYENYDANRDQGIEPLVEVVSFKGLSDYLSAKNASVATNKTYGGNPYTKLKSYQLWRKAIVSKEVTKVDPVVKSGLALDQTSKVATAGSCFAQHISRTLSNNGFTYYVAENGDGLCLDSEKLSRLNYGVFSARYGNIYTSRQLVQLFDRAYGKFTPIDTAWARKDGRLVDPFRPLVNPDGYENEQEVELARAQHYQHVREMFETLDVFVFTLGLTEAWQRKDDGAVFPLAPGVEAGFMQPEVYEFKNFETHEVVGDLENFLNRLASINPTAKVILTVSPVPLIATYEDRHVLTSTTYSKSALRAAADYVTRRYSNCEYFPSYEIITGGYNKGIYFEEDQRSVREEGVAHVMRLFMEHFSTSSVSEKDTDRDSEVTVASLEFAARNNAIVCDEEAIDPI